MAGLLLVHDCMFTLCYLRVGQSCLGIVDGMDQNDSLLRSSSTPAVAYAGLVLLLFLLAVCSLLSFFRPEILGIMAVLDQKDCIAFYSCSRICKARFAGIFHFPLSSSCRCQAHDARHLGWYGSRWTVMWRDSSGRACCTQPQVPLVQTAVKTVDFPQLQSIKVVDISFMVHSGSIPHGPLRPQKTHQLQCLDTRWSMSLFCRSCRVFQVVSLQL